MMHLPWIIALGLVGVTISGKCADPEPLIIASSEQFQSASQSITALIAGQYAAWNSGDIDGYLLAYWRSPLLIYVTEGSVWKGFDEVKANVQREYPAQGEKGHAVLERLEANVIADDLAITLEWYNMTFPKAEVHGITSETWRRFPEGWRIVQTQTTVLEN